MFGLIQFLFTIIQSRKEVFRYIHTHKELGGHKKIYDSRRR